MRRRDVDLIARIEQIRAENNEHWIDLFRLACSRYEAQAIVREMIGVPLGVEWDAGMLDQMACARRQNNRRSMKLLTLAVMAAPHGARRIMKQIVEKDREISTCAAELAEGDV